MLTVNGAGFGSGATVTVGGNACLGATYNSVTGAITCQLPAGTGFLQSVVVVFGKLISASRPLVSYAAPTVYSVSGCTANGNNTVNCARGGGSVITVNGINFGASQAQITVGGVPCANVTQATAQPHRQATCTLAAGTQLLDVVTLIQFEGQVSSQSLTVSYAQCTSGFAAAIGVIVCAQCAQGSYNALVGAVACLPCGAGTIAPSTGLTVCSACPAGQFQPTTGQTACENCIAGNRIRISLDFV